MTEKVWCAKCAIPVPLTDISTGTHKCELPEVMNMSDYTGHDVALKPQPKYCQKCKKEVGGNLSAVYWGAWSGPWCIDCTEADIERISQNCATIREYERKQMLKKPEEYVPEVMKMWRKWLTEQELAKLKEPIGRTVLPHSPGLTRDFWPPWLTPEEIAAIEKHALKILDHHDFAEKQGVANSIQENVVGLDLDVDGHWTQAEEPKQEEPPKKKRGYEFI